MLAKLKLRTNNILLLSLVVLLAGCTTIYNPATQKRESFFIGTAQEVSLGRDMDTQMQSKLKILHDPALQARVERIGQKVAAASDRQDLQYHFQVVDDKTLNAFAIPGGFVYVNSGTLAAATDDELAGVMAHEIGHVAARHSVKQLQTEMGYQLIMNIVLGLAGKQDMSNLTDAMFNIVNLGYSRADENQADKLGVKYSYRAGFNPNGLVTFFEKLKQESAKGGTGFELTFLNSHPAIDERIKNVKNEIAQLSPIP